MVEGLRVHILRCCMIRKAEVTSEALGGGTSISVDPIPIDSSSLFGYVVYPAGKKRDGPSLLRPNIVAKLGSFPLNNLVHFPYAQRHKSGHS